MGKRGPKPKSNEQKIKDGNPGKRKLGIEKTYGNYIEKSIQVPYQMRSDQIAASEWRRLSKELIDRRILTKTNLKALECYCDNYSIYRRAVKALNDVGHTFETEKGYVGQHPAISIAKGAQDQMRAWLKIIEETKPAPAKKQSKRGHLRRVF